MAVVIRMKRTGRRNRPCYRISVADSRCPRDGRTLENLGLYDPVSSNTERQATLDVERARHWIGVGATPSETVHSLFKRMGVYEGPLESRPRKRPGRKKTTRTGVAKTAAKKVRTERKATRQAQRLNEKRAAARATAAAAAGSGESSEE